MGAVYPQPFQSCREESQVSFPPPAAAAALMPRAGLDPSISCCCCSSSGWAGLGFLILCRLGDHIGVSDFISFRGSHCCCHTPWDLWVMSGVAVGSLWHLWDLWVICGTAVGSLGDLCDLSVHPCIHPCVHPHIHPSLGPFIPASIRPCFHPCIHSCIHPSLGPSLHPSCTGCLATRPGASGASPAAQLGDDLSDLSGQGPGRQHRGF